MMILGTLKDLDEAHIGDWDLNMALHNYLSVLDENYGQDRNIYEDDGGFAIIIEDEQQLQEGSVHVDLEADIYEYIEEINENYICMLKLCNNEFSVMVYIRKVLCSAEVLNCLYGNDESGRDLQTCTLQKNGNDDGGKKQCCTHDDLASHKIWK